jgi:hypothetical protein
MLMKRCYRSFCVFFHLRTTAQYDGREGCEGVQHISGQGRVCAVDANAEYPLLSAASADGMCPFVCVCEPVSVRGSSLLQSRHSCNERERNVAPLLHRYASRLSNEVRALNCGSSVYSHGAVCLPHAIAGTIGVWIYR